MSRAGTEPLRPPVTPSGPRRPGFGLPRSLVLMAASILVAGLLLGFLVGRATGPDEPSDEAAVEQNQGAEGQGGGGQGNRRQGRRKASRACRQALSLSQQVVGAQDQLLVNRGQLAEAAVAGDTATIEELNAQSDQLLAQIASLREDLDRRIRRCL